jgi:hypothetical protein
MRITDFTGSKENALAQGIYRVEFTKLKSQDDIYLKLSKQSFEGSASAGAMIRVPEEFVLAVVKQAFGASSWSKRTYSRQIPGFSALMRSRFAQFFVWPELIKFPKSTEFLFDIYSPKNIEVSGENLKYQVQASLQAQMHAPKQGKYIPFMDFSIPFSSQVQLSVAKGKVAAKFSGVALSLRESWAPSYVEKYHPTRAFARTKINKRIRAAAEGAATSYTLPRIPLTDELSLQVQKVQKAAQGTDLVFYLK